MTSRLVALDLAGGPDFVDELQRIWRAGDAAFPVDQRLPASMRTELGRTMRVGDSVEPGDALVMATSGSTSTPKGVVLTHDALAASAEATSTRLAVTAEDHWLACLPLSHVGGLSVVTRALHTGVTLTVLPGFDADAVVASNATLVSLVSAALQRIAPERFRTIVLGGARPPADRPTNCVTTYGMTETGSGIVYDGAPLDGVDVRIDDRGQIFVRGPMLLRAYRDGAMPVDRGGWLATGDLGRWDDAGLLQVDGRAGDMIISGGENIWPETVEALLATHPAVDDVLVRGVDDSEWGQLLEAIVVPADGETPDLETLRAHVKATRPAFMAPKRLVLAATLPRTSLGKLQRGQTPAPATPAPPSIT